MLVSKLVMGWLKRRAGIFEVFCRCMERPSISEHGRRTMRELCAQILRDDDELRLHEWVDRFQTVSHKFEM